MAGEYTLSVLLNARNNASGTIGQLIGDIGKLPPTVIAAGAALAAVGVAIAVSVDKAQKFQAQTLTLKTGAGELAQNMDMVRQGILKMSVDTATSTEDLTSGMFMVESAGYHGAAALRVMSAAAQGARVGNASLGVTADATTTIMKDYNLKVSQVTDAVNGLIATVSNGKTHMEDLAGSFSHILPTAAAVHVSLNDVEGAMATMTSEGVPAADSATYLRQMLIAMTAPAAGAKKQLADIGLTSADVSNEMRKSLPGALQMVVDHLKTKFPEGSAQFNAALVKIAGGSKQLQGWLDLTGNHLKEFKSNVNSVSTAVENGHGKVLGFSDVQKTFAFQMDAAKAAVNAAFIQIGTKLLPVLAQLLSAVTPLISRFASWVSTLQANSPAVAIFIGIIVGLAAIILGTVVPAFIAWAVATIAATWPLLLIAAAVAAAVAIIILVVTHWGQIGHWIQGVWSAIASFFIGLWNGIKSFFVTVWNDIIGFAKTFGIYFIAAILGPAGIILALIITHWTQIRAFLSNTWNAIKSAATTWALNLVNTVLNLKNQMLMHVQDLISRIQSFFASLPGQALTWGINLIQGFINGIMSMIGNVANAASNVVNTVKNFLGFHSPAKQGPGADADTWAPAFMTMFAKGIDANSPLVKAAVARAAGIMQQGLGTGQYGLAVTDVIGSNYSGYASGLAATQKREATLQGQITKLEQHFHVHYEGKGKWTKQDAIELNQKLGELQRMQGQNPATASGRRF